MTTQRSKAESSAIQLIPTQRSGNDDKVFHNNRFVDVETFLNEVGKTDSKQNKKPFNEDVKNIVWGRIVNKRPDTIQRAVRPKKFVSKFIQTLD